MKRFLFLILCFMVIGSPCFGANEWKNASTSFIDGDAVLFNDIDTNLNSYVLEPLDRVLSAYREGVKLQYLTTSTLTVSAGQIVCSNSAGTIRKMRNNPSATTVTWSDLDTGAEAASTTYYLYACADADATTFTIKISVSATSPTGVTYYKRIGSFYNNSSSNIEQVENDNAYMSIGYGTVANGGTISIPSGYYADECGWVVGGNSQIQTDGDGESSSYLTVSVNSSRVVTCASGGTASMATYGATCSTSYLIMCYR